MIDVRDRAIELEALLSTEDESVLMALVPLLARRWACTSCHRRILPNEPSIQTPWGRWCSDTETCLKRQGARIR